MYYYIYISDKIIPYIKNYLTASSIQAIIQTFIKYCTWFNIVKMWNHSYIITIITYNLSLYTLSIITNKFNLQMLLVQSNNIIF